MAVRRTTTRSRIRVLPLSRRRYQSPLRRCSSQQTLSFSSFIVRQGLHRWTRCCAILHLVLAGFQYRISRRSSRAIIRVKLSIPSSSSSSSSFSSSDFCCDLNQFNVYRFLNWYGRLVLKEAGRGGMCGAVADAEVLLFGWYQKETFGTWSRGNECYYIRLWNYW
jgi:hypothetical protein